MPLTRGEAVGYDAVLMVFKFTMRNGAQTVQCEISKAALGDLADRGSGAARDPRAEFEAHRDLIEAITSEQFDQKSNSNQFELHIEEGNAIGAHFFETHSSTAQSKA